MLVLLGSCGCSDIGKDYKFSAKYNEGVDDYTKFEENTDYLYPYNNKNFKLDDGRYMAPNVVGLGKKNT